MPVQYGMRDDSANAWSQILKADIRELHWHTSAEVSLLLNLPAAECSLNLSRMLQWAYVLKVDFQGFCFRMILFFIKGTTQVTTVTPDGQNYIGTVVR